MSIEQGSNVTAHYTGKLEDGTVFDSSEGKDPIAFRVGTGQLIPGFEAAVMGKEAGDKVTATIQPTEAYGDHNPEMVQDIPRERLHGADVELGQILGLETEDGQPYQASVVGVTEDTVKLDFNHFLAGKTLTFEIEVVSVE